MTTCSSSQAALARLAAAEQCGITLAVAGRDVPVPRQG